MKKPTSIESKLLLGITDLSKRSIRFRWRSRPQQAYLDLLGVRDGILINQISRLTVYPDPRCEGRVLHYWLLTTSMDSALVLGVWVADGWVVVTTTCYLGLWVRNAPSVLLPSSMIEARFHLGSPTIGEEVIEWMRERLLWSLARVHNQS